MERSAESESKVRSLKYKISEDSKILREIVDFIVLKHSKELDNFVEKMRAKINSTSKLSDDEVEQFVLIVPVYLYFLVSGLEGLGVETDTAKALRTDRYNEAFMEARGTIPDKTACAEQLVIYESLMEVAYQRAYKQLKSKVEVAMQLINSSRKVLEKRVMDMRVDAMDGQVIRSGREPIR